MSVNQRISVIMWEPCLIILLLLMEGRTKKEKATGPKEGGRKGKLRTLRKLKPMASAGCLDLAHFTLSN